MCKRRSRRGAEVVDHKILDACCGSRMFWFNKQHPATVYLDNRQLETTLCDGRMLKIAPDVVGDFKNLPFKDKQFKIVVFDPPHLILAGQSSWVRAKYGALNQETWQNDLKSGFDECMRVLDDYVTLIFKWNEDQIRIREILSVLGQEPLIGDKRAKTHWLIFMKEAHP